MPSFRPSSLMYTSSSKPEFVADVVLAKLDHLAKLPRRVDVHQREGRLGRVERLQRQLDHHGRVLADRVQHDRILELRGHLADDVNALGLQLLQMRQTVA